MAEAAYTQEQRRVIEHAGGHPVVAAVAGSGKTETLVGRVRFLLREFAPERIAVVMSNRDARESFEKRFEKALGGQAPEIRTFNSMGNKIVIILLTLRFCLMLRSLTRTTGERGLRKTRSPPSSRSWKAKMRRPTKS